MMKLTRSDFVKKFDPTNRLWATVSSYNKTLEQTEASDSDDVNDLSVLGGVLKQYRDDVAAAKSLKEALEAHKKHLKENFDYDGDPSLLVVENSAHDAWNYDKEAAEKVQAEKKRQAQIDAARRAADQAMAAEAAASRGWGDSGNDAAAAGAVSSVASLGDANGMDKSSSNNDDMNKSNLGENSAETESDYMKAHSKLAGEGDYHSSTSDNSNDNFRFNQDSTMNHHHEPAKLQSKSIILDTDSDSESDSLSEGSQAEQQYSSSSSAKSEQTHGDSPTQNQNQDTSFGSVLSDYTVSKSSDAQPLEDARRDLNILSGRSNNLNGPGPNWSNSISLTQNKDETHKFQSDTDTNTVTQETFSKSEAESSGHIHSDLRRLSPNYNTTDLSTNNFDNKLQFLNLQNRDPDCDDQNMSPSEKVDCRNKLNDTIVQGAIDESEEQEGQIDNKTLEESGLGGSGVATGGDGDGDGASLSGDGDGIVNAASVQNGGSNMISTVPTLPPELKPIISNIVVHKNSDASGSGLNNNIDDKPNLESESDAGTTLTMPSGDSNANSKSESANKPIVDNFKSDSTTTGSNAANGEVETTYYNLIDNENPDTETIYESSESDSTGTDNDSESSPSV